MHWPLPSLTSSMVHHHRLSTKAASAIALEHFGVAGRIKPLTGERDENFYIREGDGTEHVLKISHADEDAGAVDLVVSALEHLRRVDPLLPCPRLLPSLAGPILVSTTDSGGASRIARMTSWLPGRPLRSAPRRVEQRKACGDLAARLAVALSDLRHPSADRPVIWDMRNAPVLTTLMNDMPAFEHRSFVVDYVARYMEEAGSRFGGFRKQVLHNDLNAGNILVHPEDSARITAIIDFGDIVETALVSDAAIAAATHVVDADGAEERLQDFLGAYQAVLPLHEDELDALPWLIGVRKLMGVVIPLWYRFQNPADTHYARMDPAVAERNIAIARHMASSRAN